MIVKAEPEMPTLVELAARFGPMPAGRIRLRPFPATEEDVIRIDAREDRLCELVDGILIEKASGLTADTPTLEELAARFGPMPAGRIRLEHYPATEEDVVRLHEKEDVLCELIDGILVEKTVGFNESVVASVIIELLSAFVRKKKLGVVAGADGMMRLAPAQVRIPDVSFVSWSQFPGGKLGKKKVPDIHPDLAVEVFSESNTKKEMDDKLADYFASGARLVWYVDPKSRTVSVYASPAAPTVLTESDALAGEPVLPGFSVPVKELFAELP